MVGTNGITPVSGYIADLNERVSTQSYLDDSSKALLNRLQEILEAIFAEILRSV